jgi:hypothetical protein
MSCTARRARLRREINAPTDLYGLTDTEIRLVDAAAPIAAPDAAGE